MIIKTMLFSALALLTGCSSPCGANFTPLGNGLTSIGICLVASAVVRSLAELVGSRKSASSKPGRGTTSQPSSGEEEP